MKRILVTVFLIATLLCGCGAENETKHSESSVSPDVISSAETQEPLKTVEQEEVPLKFQETEEIMESTPEPEKVNAVSLTIDCTDVLDNMESLKEEKKGIIPQNGIMYANSKVEIQEGDSVFDVLKRALISSGVHLEFSLTPVYNSAYIEGIGNLYEFDCGERSGWKFSVNGEVPRVGCSDVLVKPSDKIVFFYKVIGY